MKIKRNKIVYGVISLLVIITIIVYYSFHLKDNSRHFRLFFYSYTLINQNKIVEYYATRINDNGDYKEDIEWRYDVKNKKMTKGNIIYFKKSNDGLFLLQSKYSKNKSLYFIIKTDTLNICASFYGYKRTISHQYLNSEKIEVLGKLSKVYKFMKYYGINDGSVAHAYYDQNFDLVKEVSLDDNKYDYVKELTNNIPKDFLEQLKRDPLFNK